MQSKAHAFIQMDCRCFSCTFLSVPQLSSEFSSELQRRSFTAVKDGTSHHSHYSPSHSRSHCHTCCSPYSDESAAAHEQTPAS